MLSARSQLNTLQLEALLAESSLGATGCAFYYDQADRPVREGRDRTSLDLEALEHEIDDISASLTDPVERVKFEKEVAVPFRTYRRLGTFRSAR